MSVYPQRVAENILPLSVAGSLPEAFREWRFSGEMVDHGSPIANCRLCDKEQIRYHFKIENPITKRTLWVGSKCILQFGVAVIENGVALDRKRAAKHLRELIGKKKQEACIKALTALVAKEPNARLANARAYYQKWRCLTPKYAAIIAWRLKANKIEHNPSYFKVSLQKKQHQIDLRDLETWRVHQMWRFLTSKQRELAQKLGHPPPRRR